MLTAVTRAGAGAVSVFGHCHRSLGQSDDFPSAVGPASGPPRSAVGTLFHHVLHPLGGHRADPGKAVGSSLARLPGLGWLPVSLRLQSGHLTVPAGFRRPLQLGDPLLQALDDRLLPDE